MNENEAMTKPKYELGERVYCRYAGKSRQRHPEESRTERK